MQEELSTMNKFFFNFFLTFFISIFFNYESSSNELSVQEVEVVGRSVIVNQDLKKARKLALEDALYLASLKGGAIVQGFSSVSRSTILNDQSIVKPTSKILDFKILSEKQNKEHFEIKILAVLGLGQSKTKCISKPLNITIFKGSIFSDFSLPSYLLRSMYIWYENFYEIIKTQKNINVSEIKDTNFKDVIKSSINKDYDYKALVNGLPKIQEGNYSLVPIFEITTMDIQHNFQNQYKVAKFKITLNFYKGSNFKFYKKLIIEENLPYKYISKFQFISNNFSKSLDDLNLRVRKKIISKLKDVVVDFNCTPLEGIIKLDGNNLYVDIGESQGLYNRQIGVIKSNYNNSFSKKSQNVVLYVSEVSSNRSKLIPLDDRINISKLNKMKIQFVE